MMKTIKINKPKWVKRKCDNGKYQYLFLAQLPVDIMMGFPSITRDIDNNIIIQFDSYTWVQNKYFKTTKEAKKVIESWYFNNVKTVMESMLEKNLNIVFVAKNNKE